eukprot:COSAG04_NODE_1586_length_6232_cov_11.344367_9_plen_216_part_00
MLVDDDALRLGRGRCGRYANVRLEEMLRCESSVYENAATLIKETGIRMPKCYYQGSSYPQDSAGNPSDSGACCFVCCGRRTAVRTVQIMEDLYAAGYESGPIAEGVSAERFKAMLSNIAKLHGESQPSQLLRLSLRTACGKREAPQPGLTACVLCCEQRGAGANVTTFPCPTSGTSRPSSAAWSAECRASSAPSHPSVTAAPRGSLWRPGRSMSR